MTAIGPDGSEGTAELVWVQEFLRPTESTLEGPIAARIERGTL